MGLRPQYRTNGIRLLEENRGKFSWLRIWYGFSDMTSNQNISNKRKNKYTEFIKIQIFCSSEGTINKIENTSYRIGENI